MVTVNVTYSPEVICKDLDDDLVIDIVADGIGVTALKSNFFLIYNIFG